MPIILKGIYGTTKDISGKSVMGSGEAGENLSGDL
jgi:hypothetical protein